MTPDRAPRDVVSQEESTGGQKESKPKVRKRGHGPRDWDNLEIVLDLLLDLAVEGATEGWDKVQTNQPKDYANLRRALVVRWDWDEDDNLNLLVTSTKRDPDAKSSKTKPVEQSSTITLEAVRQVLDATGRRLNLKGRGANTPEAKFTVDLIRNALDNLKDLQIRRNTVKSFYDGFWSFWILFPSDCARRKQDCIAYVEAMWEKKWSGAIDAEAGDDPDRDPLQLARTKERLDKLDRWIQANLNGWRKTFFSSYEKHQLIYVPLRLETPQPDTPPENKQCEEPATYLSNLIKTELSINNKRLILIEGEAGSGKTSLLVAAARLLMDQNLWPILLVPPKDKSHDIVKAVRRPLANVDPKISDSVVEELLRAGKLVLFIDQYSELNEDEQEWYNRELDGLNHTVIVISSRSQLQKGYFSYWEELKIKTTRLQSNEYTSFFSVWFEKLRGLGLPGSSIQKPATSTNAYPHIITTTLKQIAPDESTVLFALLAVRFYFDYHADDDCKIVSAQLAKLGLGSSRIISWHNLAFEYANKCLYSHSPERPCVKAC